MAATNVPPTKLSHRAQTQPRGERGRFIKRQPPLFTEWEAVVPLSQLKLMRRHFHRHYLVWITGTIIGMALVWLWR